MKMKVWAIGLMAAVMLAGCSQEKKTEAQPKKEEKTEWLSDQPEADVSEQPVHQKFTKEQYDQIEIGTTYDEVFKILKDPGEVVSESEDTDGNRSKILKWDNEDATGILLQFDNDKVINMSWN